MPRPNAVYSMDGHSPTASPDFLQHFVLLLDIKRTSHTTPSSHEDYRATVTVTAIGPTIVAAAPTPIKSPDLHFVRHAVHTILYVLHMGASRLLSRYTLRFTAIDTF